MKSPVPKRFLAVFQTEVLFNLKRAAPYALMFLFSANALLWWGWGPAAERGWAINSDFYIVRLFGGFSFLTLPLFIALLMGDPVIRDFRIGVDPLILSKPVSRAEYLLGKFFGNFFVLVCCQASFAVTLLLLQTFRARDMIVLSPRMLPYFQHFFFFVVVSSLTLSAFYFAVGTLTRNVKIVYSLAVSFYFLYVAWQSAIRGLPLSWRIALDPLLFNVGAEAYKGYTPNSLNQLTIRYDGSMVVNRVLVIAVSLFCLAVLYFRFSRGERAKSNSECSLAPSLLNLSPPTEAFDSGAALPLSKRSAAVTPNFKQGALAFPLVNLNTQGIRTALKQFSAMSGIEFRLLRAERSLIAVVPLIMLLCGAASAAYLVVPEISYSATYASRSANTLLLFLFGIATFYTGETIHRDREEGIEDVLWSYPIANSALLISKFAATLLLAILLMFLVGLTALGIQAYKGHSPYDLQPYLITYVVILIPSAVFMSSASIAINIILRDKYLAYALCLALGGGLYYLVGQGYNHPLFNPVLYQLWKPVDLEVTGGRLTFILIHRVYTLALSTLLVAVALLFFRRKSTRALNTEREITSAAWTIFVAIVSMLIAVIASLIINAGIQVPSVLSN